MYSIYLSISFVLVKINLILFNFRFTYTLILELYSFFWTPVLLFFTIIIFWRAGPPSTVHLLLKKKSLCKRYCKSWTSFCNKPFYFVYYNKYTYASTRLCHKLYSTSYPALWAPKHAASVTFELPQMTPRTVEMGTFQAN